MDKDDVREVLKPKEAYHVIASVNTLKGCCVKTGQSRARENASP